MLKFANIKDLKGKAKTFSAIVKALTKEFKKPILGGTESKMLHKLSVLGFGARAGCSCFALLMVPLYVNKQLMDAALTSDPGAFCPARSQKAAVVGCW